MFRRVLESLSPDQLCALEDRRVSTYTTTSADDPDLLQNGAELGRGGLPVTFAMVRGTDGLTAYFVAGTEADALAIAERCRRENPDG